MKNHYDLKGKNILLTGANGQLGQGFAQALVANSAFVYATDLQPEIEPVLKSKLDAIDSQLYAYRPLNIASASEVRALADEIGEEIDILVNNAGLAVFTPFENRTEQEIDSVMDVNLKGTILCSQAFSKYMAGRKSGSIINIGSIYGCVAADKKIYGDSGRNSSEIYAATKAGVIHFSRYLAAYLGDSNVRVNSVSPGGVFNNQKKFFVDSYQAKTPLKRMGEVADLTGLVCFLCSADAAYITGQNFLVDGGFSLNQ